MQFERIFLMIIPSSFKLKLYFSILHIIRFLDWNYHVAFTSDSYLYQSGLFEIRMLNALSTHAKIIRYVAQM